MISVHYTGYKKEAGNKMNVAVISDLLQFGERLQMEAKLAKNDVPKSLWETYSSFCNTMGGYILLGVYENMEKNILPSDRFTIVGVENADKIIKDFWSTINSEKVNKNLMRDEDIEIIDFAGKTIICIRVPQAEYRDKPVFINGNPFKGTFKRTYEGDFHCTEDEVKNMIRDANDDGNDGVLIEHYDMEDIDVPTIRAYRNIFMQRNPDHVWNAETDKEFLRNMGGYTINRTNGKECLTLAGLMMFGKGLPVRERFSNFRMDYLDKSNLLSDERWSDRITYDGRWENNLFNFFRLVLPKLTMGTKRPFRMDGIERIDDTPVNKALREAFTNSIIHADLMMSSGVLKVEKTDEGFVFSNPGSLKLPIERIYEGGHSKARNPRIQNMLRMIGFGENIGSGFPSILNAWHLESWRMPDLHEEPDLKLVELKLWTASLVSDETETLLRHQFGETFDNLSTEEKQTMATAVEEGLVTNSRMQQLLKLNSLEVSKLLTHLVALDLLRVNGKGRGTSYTANRDFIPSNEGKGNEGKGNGGKGKNTILRRKRILDAIRINNKVTYSKMSKHLNCGESTIYRDFQFLREQGYITRVGGPKHGYWLIIKKI